MTDTYIVRGTISSEETDIVQNGHQCGSGQVLSACLANLVLVIHVAKALNETKVRAVLKLLANSKLSYLEAIILPGKLKRE